MNVDQKYAETQDPRQAHGATVPAVPVKKPGSLRWIIIVAILLGLGGIGFFVHMKGAAKDKSAAAASASAAADRVVPVLISTVEVKDVPIVLEGLGNVLPLATVTVKTLVDGRLDSVNFKEGQMVKKGDLLAQVDPRPFAIQLKNAQAALAKDNANLENSRLNEQRYDQLVAQKLIATQQATDQRAQTAQLAAQAKQDDATIDTAKLNLDYSRIVSPIDGVTGVRLVDQGNIVHAADTGGIVVLTQLDPIAVLFTLPEDDLPRVQKELAKGDVLVDAYGRDGVEKLGMGKVSVVDNQINTTTATIRLKAVFPNPERVLWPNEFVKARMTLSTKKNAIVVPATVVQKGPQGVYAYVMAPDKTVSMRMIEVDMTQGEIAIISKGLSVGEQVVADGQNQLKPGSKVQPRVVTDTPSSSPDAVPSASGEAVEKHKRPHSSPSASPSGQSPSGAMQ